MTTYNVTLNGVSPFSAFGQTFNWDPNSSGSYLESFQPWTGSDPGVSHVLNATLTGSNWFLPIFRLSGNTGLTTTLTDSASGTGRQITFLRLGQGDATVTLRATQVNFIEGYGSGAGDVTLTTGFNFVQSVRFYRGDNVVTVGTGDVGTVVTSDGNDRLAVGANQVDYANLGDGNNIVTIGTGRIDDLRFGDGNDTLTIADGRVDFAALGDGLNRVTLGGDSRILALQASEATNIVRLQGEARAYLVKLDSSVNTVTTAQGNVESLYAYNSSSTLNIGAGGVQQIVLSGDEGRQVVNAQGFLGSLRIESEASILTLGSGGADSVILGDGANRVTSGSGYLALLITGDGNDLVSLGTGGAGFVRLNGGDDRVSIRAFNPNRGVEIQGEDGRDTVDLSRMGAALTVELDGSGRWQDVAQGRGYVGFTQVENLIGGAFGDRLTGGSDANRLSGGGGGDTLKGLAGADSLLGGAGADRLFGGAGNDLLDGGAGGDRFVFGAGEGQDRIEGFDLGADRLQFLGTDSLSDIVISNVAGGARLSAGGTVVVVEGLTAAQMAAADNFLF